MAKTAGIATEMGLLSLLMTLLPMSMAAPVLPTPEALGKPYGLYGSDKENLLKRLTKSTKHLIEWDESYTLENAAGLAASCEMIKYDLYSWHWEPLKTPRVQSQLDYFTHGRGAAGIFGVAKSSTLLSPWEEWQDLKRIVHQWEKAPEFSGEHKALMHTDKIGCAVVPGCLYEEEYYTVLVCLLSPKMQMVPSSEEVEIEHQPHTGFSGPIPGESPLTPVEAQSIKQVAPPAPDDVVLGKQDFMPEELYSKDNLNRQFETELAHLQNDFYPNSQELELESQPGEVWRSI